MTITQVEAALGQHPNIRLAYVFGSVAAGTARGNSDVDVAVLCDGPMTANQQIQLISDIAEATGRAVDLIDLATVGEPLLGQILQHGVRIIGGAERHARLVSKHILNNEDFMPYVERLLAERRQRWIG
ncbi:DNA polymerase III subunit beta [Stutzerimonas stutzeri]|uniref:DNA polymerase III subunit beta n=1 Tax=Stutzerimonas stutzeri TaxID=316 RepID=W8QX42_STUST|nr:nucleotidyltransferase domain-containing protein [Stutzerimonas stutzeri]AHL75190.1 DNA polymerase III subunit beta [Stutzerimonas stutzeri]MCQ4328264.1 nucleotidyltransferase domain-containing protein [Stutzerimonas stutzeri]